MKVGDKVQYAGGRLFTAGPAWSGIVKRMPLTTQSGTRRATDNRVLVQVGNESRLRPALASELTVISL